MYWVISLPVFSNHHKNGGDVAASIDIIDEHQLNEYLSFLNESSSSSRAKDLVDLHVELDHGGHDWAHSMNNGDAHFHKRSYLANDAYFGSKESGLGTGYKPCLYFARGFCNNGSNCKFVHGGFANSVDVFGAIVSFFSKSDGFEQYEEIMRLKATQQLRLTPASQFMNGGVSPSQYKYMNYLLQQHNDLQRAAAVAGFIMGGNFYMFGRCRPERNNFLSMASTKKQTRLQDKFT